MIAANSEPTTIVRRWATAVDGGEAVGVEELGPRDERDGAAADTVEQGDQLRHRGHLGAQRRRDTEDDADDQAGAMIRSQLSVSRMSIRIATTATSMPTAAM